jgi:hypothetical protein
MIYTTHNHYYNNLKTLKFCRQQIIGGHKNIVAGKRHKNKGVGKNLGSSKLLAPTKHWRIQKLRRCHIISIDKILGHIKTKASTNY